MIEMSRMTRTDGHKRAVDDISFVAPPCSVTGILGPNGAGKSTTMRMIMGLDRPDSGTATIKGKPLADHVAPKRAAGRCSRPSPCHRAGPPATTYGCWPPRTRSDVEA
ncbi:ATP-binding cassette domain-containing protein [Isoptericola sediminis]|uniref:ATP-binding cassette domain-containing protein n=1 Tax=Isoptericola sediminis TaxID=2733572 RepID=A0A849K9Y7_9MICO|nr:ATP-binding cassette domain-containing protein [Isoptericola sediminis]